MTQIVQLEAARTRVILAPALGGRIVQLEAQHQGTWVALLHEPAGTAPERREPMSWGSFVMAPWPNRIAHGRFTWRGDTFAVPPNLGDHAIHGVCFDRAWSVEAATSATCVMRIDFDARWPFGGHALQRVEALDDGIVQTVEIRADGLSFPAGVGWHPWFRRDVTGAEHTHVRVDAPVRYELRDQIPTGRLLPVRRDHDLRDYPALGERRLDDCYRCSDGAMRVRWGNLELWMESSANVTHAVVYTPQHAVCVEPQTCATDAFNLDDADAGAVIVEPGRPLVASTTWRWASAEPQWQQIHPRAVDDEGDSPAMSPEAPGPSG